MNNKITALEAICIIIIFLLNNFISDLPYSFIYITGSGSIINTIYISILAFIFFFTMLTLLKKMNNSDLLTISNFIGGKKLKKAIGILYIILLIFVTSNLIRDFASGLNLTYFSEMPLYFLSFIFLAPASIIAFNKRSTLLNNIYIVPVMIISILIIFITISRSAHISKTFPILGYNLNKTFLAGSTNIFAFNSLAYFFFLLPLLEKNKNKDTTTKTFKLSFGLTTFLLICGISSLIIGLPYLRYINELPPIYLLTRSANYTDYFQRPESLFIFIWILGLMSFISISIRSIKYLLSKTFDIPHSNDLIPLITSTIWLLAILPISIPIVTFLENITNKYLSIFTIFLLSGLIILLGYKKFKKLQFKGDLNTYAK